MRPEIVLANGFVFFLDLLVLSFSTQDLQQHRFVSIECLIYWIALFKCTSLKYYL